MTDRHEPPDFIEPGRWAAHATVVNEDGKTAAGLTRNVHVDHAPDLLFGVAYGALQNSLTSRWQVTTR
jgi:hypothetical protein